MMKYGHLFLSYSSDEIWISFHIGEGLACWQGCWSIEMPKATCGRGRSCSEKVHLTILSLNQSFLVRFPHSFPCSSAFIDIRCCWSVSSLSGSLIFISIFRFLRKGKYFKCLVEFHLKAWSNLQFVCLHLKFLLSSIRGKSPQLDEI